jgi:asparagine synthetase B (glutamine-hydrolysing)
VLFGWCGDADEQTRIETGYAMGEALRVRDAQRFHVTALPGLVIGQYDEAPLGGASERSTPAPVVEGPAYLWMAGEAFAWPSRGLSGPIESRTAAFQQRLLRTLLADGDGVLADLDGEYQIALWNTATRSLTIWGDRFAGVPLYWARTATGPGFAGGVRGVLMTPGLTAAPDGDAIREAVSFGGYRLGSRTNVRGVQMAPPAYAVTMSAGDCTVGRHWHWDQLDVSPATANASALLGEVREAWRSAIARRLEGASRPGLTLSGGLDSRAILAEAARQNVSLSALTYGVANSDDVRFARRAARAAGARWTLFPLYADGWLERRVSHILPTDGLMELADLMHLEPAPLMPELYDLYVSGCVGETVSGSRYDHATTPEGVLAALPYYGGRLGIPHQEALDRAAGMLAGTRGHSRFVVFEQKLPQAISRIPVAASPYARVRRPFLDYRFFDLCQQVPSQLRAEHVWHERWLRSTYPEFYARIPNQRTGAPAGASARRVRATRIARFAWRKGLGVLRWAGVPVRVPERQFHPDDAFWTQPGARAMIEATICRSGSISIDVFGRQAVSETLDDYFGRWAAPIQVVGSMFVFERYHQTLAASLAAARARAQRSLC